MDAAGAHPLGGGAATGGEPQVLLRLSWAALGRLFGLEHNTDFWVAAHAIPR